MNPEHLEASVTPSEAKTPERSTRRSFVFFGALAATALLPGRSYGQRSTRMRRPIHPRSRGSQPAQQPSESVAAFAEWSTSSSRLVRRVTLGVTPADMAHVSQLGYEGYLNHQLSHTRINDSVVEGIAAQKWPMMFQPSDQLFGSDAGQLRSQLQESTIFRAAFSQRQLYHRMVELWSDHFNQDVTKVGYLLVADQRDVIRANALGSFPALLKASAHSASMMLYLDQESSRGGAPNQNYAREIMELHSLGVDGGYTQNDVAELARVLTGWTITGKGQFTFNPATHDWGAKTVLGVTIPQGSPAYGAEGIKEGEQMLDVLAYHPSTARFIATKMLRWLLDPNPSETQISTVASVYRATGGDIKSMIRVILNDSWLPAAPMKFKRPFHFMVSTLRSANPAITIMSGINGQLSALGHPIYTWPTPDGFPDKIEYWAGNIVPRWNFAYVLSTARSTTAVAFDAAPYLSGSPAAAVDLIDQVFFGAEMPMGTRTALLSYVNSGTFNDQRVREAISLAISANAFQWY